jgi:hypothetical protein
MSYAAVDAVISEWAAVHRLTLSTEFGGKPRRFCYVSGGEHECFQVSIEPPEGATVTVNAWSIETEDDAELHQQWLITTGELSATLDAALKQISRWSVRPRSRRWGQQP